MEKSAKILSDIVVYNKYAKYMPELKRRETFEEICNRNLKMHIQKFRGNSEVITELNRVYADFVKTRKILPSMRSMQFAGKPIEISPNRLYNCFDRSTRFVTTEGTKSFEDFENGDVVYVPTHTGEIKRAVVGYFGEQELQKVTFSRATTEVSVNVTKNHRWLLNDGSETTNLTYGDKLIATPNTFKDFDYDSATPEEKLYWCYGLVYGDGTRIKDSDGNYKYSMIRLCGNDKKYADRFIELGFKTSTNDSLKGDFFAYTGSYLKTCPDLSIDSIEKVRAFVGGYLAADGSKNPDWYSNNDLSPYRGIQSSEVDHIEFIEKCFEAVGVYIIGRRDLTGEVTNYGTRPETCMFKISSSLGNNSRFMWKVKYIEPIEESQSVWCLMVEDNKSFILSGGIVTGNCAGINVDHPAVFSETMFLLLGGSGVGYSIQRHHVEQLPAIRKPSKTRRYVIGDSIEGWADAIKILMRAYFEGRPEPRFDYSGIREKGSLLVTSGGKAPGPQPLHDCLHKIRGILTSKEDGEQLSTLEVHDIMCHIADAVLAGGIRRAAMIALFDLDDEDMLSCKYGNWWELNPQRGRANNSAVVLRHKITKEVFDKLWNRVELSGSGEPGIYFSNDKDWTVNPCCEIALKSCQFCNLVEVNVSDVETQEELNARIKAATFLATIQASYTDFHYLRDVWRRNSDKDALIGVSMTGVASGTYKTLDLEEASKVVLDTNKEVAELIGINKAARTTCLKPAGTTSLVFGCASGIHAYYAPFYIRRMRLGKDEGIYKYLEANHPNLVTDEFMNPTKTAVLEVPVKSPEGAIMRTESPIELLERIKHFSTKWVKTGHIKGENTHNVSATVSIQDDEWEEVGEWMWDNRACYNGLSVLNFDGGSYSQTPFEEIDEETYNELMKDLEEIDLTKVIEEDDNTEQSGAIACGSGGCELV